jgi:gamma-glutamylcyclotransferase (GGCT)/AIG2-like uncharacterized protein YtfP
MINNLLFVYGSLLGKENEFATYLNNNASIYSEGKFRGKLHDIGEHPGAVAYPEGEDVIVGNIVILNEPQHSLQILDDYEGFGPDQSQPNLFIRKSLPVETINGIVVCWIYLYNLPVSGFKPIISGDYLAYKGIKS